MDGRGDDGEPVAIIGMACRFPGARDPAEFHDLTVAGRGMFQAATALPGRPLRAAVLDDWSVPQMPADDPLAGALLPQDLGPVRKLAAEMTALALTDAGLREVAGTCRTGLIIASSVPGLGDQVREDLGFAACGPSPRPARVSSLHAVVAAAGALRTGELDLAVAGGAELGLDPVWLALQDRAGTLGTGEMRVYAADPAGLLPGEGCGMVVLVRAADARAAGVPIYAEIAGWSTSPAAPSELAGPALLQAYQRARVDPADVQLIEGQGIGTATGDSAELAAFTQLRRGGRSVAALGAISACIGYARAAAGVASLVKTAVAMAAGTIPPGPGGARPHQLIASSEALLRLPVRPEPWPDGDLGPSGARRPRFAAVNSLGTADPAVMAGHPSLRDAEGIHLVLRREAETDRWTGRRRRGADRAGAVDEAGGADQAGAVDVADGVSAGAELRGSGVVAVREGGEHPRVFVLRGGNPGRLAGQLDVIAASAAGLADAGLDRLARQLAVGALQAGDHPAPLRVALTAGSPRQLASQAGDAARLLRTGSLGETGGPGETGGSPEVRISAGAGGSVVVLFPGCAESAAVQPALLAVSLQVLGTLDMLGVRPATGVGYGLAEITGLSWAGCIPTAEAARLVAQCGQVLRACACGTGAMARVTADAETARVLSAPDRLHIAAYEGPRTHVLAGSTTGVRELTRRAAMLGIAVEVLDGAIPMHFPGMARCAAPLRSVLAGTSFGPPRRRLVSTITGRLVTAKDDLAHLLAGQVTRPVLFAQAMAQAAAGADLIVTAGPDAGLAARAAECGGVPAVPIPAALPPGDREQRGRLGAAMAQAIAALFTAGALTDLTPFVSPARKEARWPAGRWLAACRECGPRRRAAPPRRSVAPRRETRSVR